MTPEQRLSAFSRLGSLLEKKVETGVEEQSEALFNKTTQLNPWFIRKNILYAIASLAEMLKEDQLDKWLVKYDQNKLHASKPKNVGVVNAGNIPFVGFHDFLCVLISGNNYIGKNASDDMLLLPWIAEELIKVEPKFKERISFVEKLKDIDAVIATGSNNTARYFEYYFGKYSHIIRKNRNAIAVLKGDESKEELTLLGEDIFRYFGLGCRNVSKLYVPRGYNFNGFFEAIFSFSKVMQHNKYMNNYDYNRAVFLMRQIPFLENNFLIIREDSFIPSPISVVHYEFYDDDKKLKENLAEHKEQIQCIIGSDYIPFGQAQCPSLWDYADGMDTMDFLLSL